MNVYALEWMIMQPIDLSAPNPPKFGATIALSATLAPNFREDRGAVT
jgi:hypothetical protein